MDAPGLMLLRKPLLNLFKRPSRPDKLSIVLLCGKKKKASSIEAKRKELSHFFFCHPIICTVHSRFEFCHTVVQR